MNNKEEFAERLNNLRPKIVKYIGRKIHIKTEAEDLAQETIYKALKSQHLYSGRGSFEGWVYRIAYNLIVDGFRSRVPETRPINDLSDDVIAGDDVHAVTEKRSMVRCIHDEIDKLSNNDRRIISLKYISGLTHKQIAAEIGCSVDAAKMALSRARGRFRDNLEQACEFCHDEQNEFICQSKKVVDDG